MERDRSAERKRNRQKHIWRQTVRNRHRQNDRGRGRERERQNTEQQYY